MSGEGRQVPCQALGYEGADPCPSCARVGYCQAEDAGLAALGQGETGRETSETASVSDDDGGARVSGHSGAREGGRGEGL